MSTITVRRDAVVAPAPRPAAGAARTGAVPRPEYSVAMGYLRGFAILLVIVGHSLLAYYAGPFPFTQHVLRMAFPIRDPHHFAFARMFNAFDDNYLMSLIFFVSGMFLWRSLRRKGAGAFVQDRLLRLGVPFLIAAGVGGGLAYYPAYLQAHPSGTIADYFAIWQRPGQWMIGAAWFIGVLFAFDILAAALFVAWPCWGERLARLSDGAAQRPLRYLAIVVAVTAVAYIPLALWLGPFTWWNAGPFWIQSGRTLVYAAYFYLGVGFGAHGLGGSLVAPDGALARRWWAWGLAAVAVFLIVANAIRVSVNDGFTQSLPLGLLVDLGWVLDCAVASFAVMAIFCRFARPNALMESLSQNAYGMYLTHYPMVTWAQFALLASPMPPALKGLIVIAAATSGSWLLTASLRRFPLLARII